jgi:hypothetical protein
MANPPKRSVVLLYPTGGTNEDVFTVSLVGAISYDAAHNGYLADAVGINGLYVDSNRDLGARRFMRYRLCDSCRNVISQGNIVTPDMLRCNFCDKDVPEPLTPEWLWWVDTDIHFPEYGILDKLLECADPVERPVMSALYFGYMNSKTLVPVWYGRNEKDGQIEPLNHFKSGLNRLGVCGMGCCIIHRSVFEKFGDRWAKTGFLYFGRDRAPWTIPAHWNNDMTPFVEDNCFCWRCNELGIPIYGNSNIIVNHMKKRFENFRTFLQSFEQKEEVNGEAGTITRMRRQQAQAIMGERAGEVGGIDDAGLGPGSEPGRSTRFKYDPLAIRR